MTADADTLGRRYLVVLAVVAVWMLAGFAFRLSGNAYVVAGVPLLLAFQVFVARRPIAELWFKKPGGAPLPLWGWAAAAAFMAFPIHSLANDWAHSGWDVRLWYACAIAGAVPLAFSLARFSRGALRSLLLCLGTAGALGILFALIPGLLAHFAASLTGAQRLPDPFQGDVGPKLREMGRSFALYLPVVFVLEEVFFRGGLDSYLNRSDDRDPWVSAAFVAAIWGLWHMPLLLPALLHSSVSWAAVGFTAVAVMAIHCVVGTPLALFWRSSGLLFVPAFVHALIDAVRNGAAVR